MMSHGHASGVAVLTVIRPYPAMMSRVQACHHHRTPNLATATATIAAAGFFFFSFSFLVYATVDFVTFFLGGLGGLGLHSYRPRMPQTIETTGGWSKTPTRASESLGKLATTLQC